MSILSKEKEQKKEYKRIKNESFDKKIAKAKKVVEELEAKKVKFNEEIDQEIATLKD